MASSHEEFSPTSPLVLDKKKEKKKRFVLFWPSFVSLILTPRSLSLCLCDNVQHPTPDDRTEIRDQELCESGSD